MKDILRRLKGLVSSLIGMDLIKEEDPSAVPKLLDDLNTRLLQIKSAAVRVIAHQYRIENQLSLEKQKFSQLEIDSLEDLYTDRIARLEKCWLL